MDIKQEILKYDNEIRNWRRELHKIPEIGNNLPQTVDYVSRELEKMGIEYIKMVGGNAIVATINGKNSGKCIALRADMDALPIIEETGHSFSSTNNNMHACGHDGHTAMLLGAGKFFSTHRELFNGSVKLLFQPGEESPGGAQPMILERALKNPDVDAVCGLHNGHIGDNLSSGEVSVSYGPIMAAVDVFYIDIIGKGCHGAYPEQGIDPIVIASEVVTSLQRIISREIAPSDIGLLSICSINGGINENVIPDRVKLQGTVRTVDPMVQDKIERRINEISSGICSSYGANCEVRYVRKYPATINDKKFTEKFMDSLLKVVDKEKVKILDKPVMGAEDMSFFLREVPGTYFFLTNPKEIDGQIWPHHNSKFDLDESQFATGTAIFVQAALDFLK